MSASPLVSCEWLKDNLDKVKVLDASWYLSSMERAPGVKFDAVGEFEKQRIPGAAFFDIDKICDCESPHPHMMPSAEFFAQCVASLGVQRDDHVVVYDGKGIFSAPRAWTMFQLFGHPKVQILDGGMPAWLDAGFDVETSPQSAAALDRAVETYGDAAGPSGVPPDNTSLSMRGPLRALPARLPSRGPLSRGTSRGHTVFRSSTS